MYYSTYYTKNPATFQPECTTGPHINQWMDYHIYACKGGFIAHAWQGLLFGSRVPNVYIDMECSKCHEHYIEIYSKGRINHG